jgi:hypothetical protein
VKRKIVRFEEGKLDVHLIWRNDAYNHWAIELPAEAPISNYSSPSKANVIVRGGYLMRTATISGNELRLVGDTNATTNIELIHEPTGNVTNLSSNGVTLNATKSTDGFLGATVPWTRPSYTLPDLRDFTWKYIDSLPEAHNKSYDDSNWTLCDHNTTTNPHKLETPSSLYASDYGFHTGSILYRGHLQQTAMNLGFYSKQQEAGVLGSLSGLMALSWDPGLVVA